MTTAHVANAEREKLADFFARMQKVMKSNAAGPLVVSVEVVRLGKRWGTLPEKETGGSTLSQHTFEHLGFRLPWFELRARAVEALGKDVVTWAHEELARRLMRIPDATLRKKVVDAILRNEWSRARLKRGLFITLSQAGPIIRSVLGKSPRPAPGACATCAKLRALLKKNGIEE